MANFEIYLNYQKLASFQICVQNVKKSQNLSVSDFKLLLNKMQFSPLRYKIFWFDTESSIQSEDIRKIVHHLWS